jgi:glycosyltransferase involved in cell wall biosynthesis
VGFDARALHSPAAGVRRYITQLIDAIRRVSPETELVAVGVRNTTNLPPGVIARRSRGSLPTNLGWMLTGIPLATYGHGLDVFHAPAYTAPLAGTPPVVLTVHDVSYARRPGDYPYKLDPIRQWFYRASARHAAAIVTDSAFSASEIEAAYEIRRDQIAVVPLAADQRFCPVEAGHPLPELAGTPYVLHVGELHARRRPGLLLEAILRVRDQHPSLQRLAIVFIGRDRGEGPALAARARAAGVPDVVRLLGARSDEDLLMALRGASAFVYASRYEGFGLPVLEAMACGTPVVAAAEASVSEVVADGGCLVADASAETFAAALATVLLDGTETARLRRMGLLRAAQFSWERTARETLAVYARVAARRRL